MNLPEFSVKQPIATIMLFLAIALIGLFSLDRLSVDLYPEVEPPFISIITTWPGASASDVETEVTEEIESWANMLNDLDTLYSRSMDNLSIVSCRFDFGTDLDAASNDIRDMLGFVRRDLPDDAEEPIIFKLSSSTMPILYLNITADQSWPSLYHIADNEIGDELKRVPGVGGVVIHGGMQRQINVYFDMEKIEKFHLSLQRVNQILAAENLNIPAGSVKYGQKDYFVRVPARYDTIGEMKDTIIGNFNNRPVYLKDVATVADDFEPLEMYAYGDGKPGILMMVMKQSGSNTVDVIDEAKTRLERIRGQLPSDVKVKIAADASEDIIKSIHSLRSTLFWSIFFIAVVTVLFLRKTRSALIIIFNIPFCLIGSFIFIYLFGYTINMVTLLAIAIASGLVLDSGIVVLDNIVRYLERGRKINPSSVFGANEMGIAITASTMTTVVVFAPLMFVGGIAGIIFRPLAFVVVITLGISLLAALMLTPMLASKWLDPEKENPKVNGFIKKAYEHSEKGFKYLESRYTDLLDWSLRHRKTVIFLAVAVFISSLSFIPFLSTSFFPNRDTGDISVSFRMEEGTRIEETVGVLENVMNNIHQLVSEEELRSYAARVGRTKEGISSAVGFEEGTNAGSLTFKLVDKDKRQRSVEDVAKGLRDWFAAIPGIIEISVITKSSTESAMQAGQKPINIEIQGYDMEKNMAFAREVLEIMERIPGAADVNISQKDPRPEIWIEIDRKKASDLGLNIMAIAGTLRNYIYGIEVSKFRDSGESFNIVTRFTEEDKNRLENLGNIPLMTMEGRMVKLKNVAAVRQGLGPIEIERKNRQRIVQVQSDLYQRALGEVAADIRSELNKIGTPPGITVEMGGEVEDQREAFRDLTVMLILGIILVYMIMASLFGDLRDPFIVMFSVPFAFSGVIIAYYITDTTLSLLSFMGVIMLMGIVVNNAIVLIHYIHLLQKRGLSVVDSIRESGRARLRPVLMTTCTTFFAMLPVATSTRVGAEGWRDLGITILGGLSVSALITLLLIPTLYYMFERRKAGSISSGEPQTEVLTIEAERPEETKA
ncbi:MAG: efflux RND transporter permease subunit [Desulfobacterales bacterium]